MGLAVLPSRLKKELADLGQAIVEGRNIENDQVLSKHAAWVRQFSGKYGKIDSSNVEKIIQDEVGIVFSRVLEDAGVFKRNEDGMKAFARFIESL